MLLLVITRLSAQTDVPIDKSPRPQPKQTVPESIVVTGTYAPEPDTEIDRSISVIEISEHGPLYKNWVDALALSPSIDLRQRAPNDIQGVFRFEDRVSGRPWWW